MEIKYGLKSGSEPTYKTHKIINAKLNPVPYPSWLANSYEYKVSTFYNGRTKDIGMTFTLNQEKRKFIPFGVIEPVDIMSNVGGGSIYCYNTFFYYPSNNSVFVFDVDCLQYAPMYRDDIWINLAPQAYALFPGCELLWAKCNLNHKTPTPPSTKDKVHHSWGIEKVCLQWVCDGRECPFEDKLMYVFYEVVPI
jgi:hypothetical protein